MGAVSWLVAVLLSIVITSISYRLSGARLPSLQQRKIYQPYNVHGNRKK